MRHLIHFFILFFIFSCIASGRTNHRCFGNEELDTNAAHAQFQETLLLKFVWMHEERIREAILMVPPQKVPMLLLRVLDENEKMTGLAAARGEFLMIPKNENENENETENENENENENGAEDSRLTLLCSDPQTLFGPPETMQEIPELILIQGARGAVDLHGTFAPCLVAPVLPEDEEKVLGAFRIPECPQENTPKTSQEKGSVQ